LGAAGLIAKVAKQSWRQADQKPGKRQANLRDMRPPDDTDRCNWGTVVRFARFSVPREAQMTDSPKPAKKTLSDCDICRTQAKTRRQFFQTMAIGGAAAVTAGVAASPAHAGDIDNGVWIDKGSCPRGAGGVWTGFTDVDSGAISDDADFGRGDRLC